MRAGVLQRKQSCLLHSNKNTLVLEKPTRRETSVAAKDLVLHNGSYGQTVETVGECLPQLDTVPSLACGSKDCQGVILSAWNNALLVLFLKHTHIRHKNRRCG